VPTNIQIRGYIVKTKVLAGVALAAMMGFAGSASAASTIFLKLTKDTCSGTCGLTGGASYGEVEVDGIGTNVLSFDILLSKDIFFNQAGKPVEAFSATDGAPGGPPPTGPTVTIGNITAGFLGGVEAAGAINEGPTFGTFLYSIDWVGPPTNNGNIPGAGKSELKFTVTGPSGSALELAPGYLASGGKNPTFSNTDYFFVADLYGSNGKTGKVGAVLDKDHVVPQGGVPEPVSWALMLVGFGGLGAALRRRRALALHA